MKASISGGTGQVLLASRASDRRYPQEMTRLTMVLHPQQTLISLLPPFLGSRQPKSPSPFPFKSPSPFQFGREQMLDPSNDSFWLVLS